MIFLSTVEYIFVYVRLKYQKWGESDIAGVYAIGIISTIELINILTLLFIASALKIIDVNKIENFYFVLMSLIVLLLNYLYIYKIKGIKNIIDKFQEKQENYVEQKIALYYILFSAVSFLGIFFYLLKK